MVLLDEIEKAHPDVFNVLLQILDDGRLTDGQGRTVDFKNTVVIMTSNIGSQWILELGDRRGDGGEGHGDRPRPLQARVPEPGRRDHRLPPARREHSSRSSRSSCELLTERLAEREHQLRRDRRGAKRYLAEKGYDPAYGARPLKRLIQREIENELALKLLDGTFHDGDTIKIAAGDEGLDIR